MRALKIRRLQARNFRNLCGEIGFVPGINCIGGGNGNGKTNILEAVHLLIARKSFRKNAGFPQYLGIDGEKPEISLASVFEDEADAAVPYSGRLDETGSRWFLRGRPTRQRLPVGVVFISPFDGQGFYASPSVRRAWFDRHLGQVDPLYKKLWRRYREGLRFRNALLGRRPPRFGKQVRAVDSKMAPWAAEITARRKQFLAELSPLTGKIFKTIFDKEHRLEIELVGCLGGGGEGAYARLMEASRAVDEARGHTSQGVHRDDYRLLFDGFHALDYCSLGQQKMAYLGLVFAYTELFGYKCTSFPIVLLDDVSGELDKVRWTRFVGYLRGRPFQVLVTTANRAFEEELGGGGGVHRMVVRSGEVFPFEGNGG